MEKGEEAPCRVPLKRTNRFKYMDLLFFKKFISKLDSTWDKQDYLGIEKLYKDDSVPDAKDQDDIFNPLPKRSWWHRPYYYRSFSSYMQHRNNLKRLKKYGSDAFVFKGHENKKGQFLNTLKETVTIIKDNSFSVSIPRLRQIVNYLQYLKIEDHGYDVNDNSSILSVEEEIQTQAAKVRIAWREDWKNFWREYPPLDTWEAPRSLSDPDPHIPFDVDHNILFNDILWYGSGQEDYIEQIYNYKKSLNPISLLKYGIGSSVLSNSYRDHLIRLREAERRDRFQLGSIHRGGMDVVLDYIPGWNHATHTYDYGRRNSMNRTFREEEEIMARYPEPLSIGDRNDSVPPHMELFYLWRSFPDPVYSKFAYIDSITHSYQLKAEAIGDVEGATALIPDFLKRRTTPTQLTKHWLYMYSTQEGFNHEMGHMLNSNEQHSLIETMTNSPNFVDKLLAEPEISNLLGADETKRIPLTKNEMKEAILNRRGKVSEWKIRLLSNRSFIALYKSFKSVFKINTRIDAFNTFKRVFSKHLPELLKGQKKIPDDIKDDIKDYGKSWKHFLKGFKLDDEKLKYVSDQRKKIKSTEPKKSNQLHREDKKEYHTTPTLKFFSEEERKFLRDAVNTIKKASTNPDEDIPIPTYSYPEEEYRKTDSTKLSDYIDLKNYPKIRIKKPNPDVALPFPKLLNTVSKIHDDPFVTEMEFIAQERAKNIRSVLGELYREKILKKSHLARKLEKSRSNLVDSIARLVEKYPKKNVFHEEYSKPVGNLTEEFINSLTGTQHYQPKSIIESLLMDDALRKVLLPSETEIQEEYNFFKQRIDTAVYSKLQGRKVDEVEYFLEYVTPFFEEVERDPSEKKKGFLLLRLDEYSRLITRHPKLRDQQEKYWDKVFNDYRDFVQAKEDKEGKPIDPSFNEPNFYQARLKSVDELLEENGIFINSVTKRLFPIRQNRWFPNIIYGPDGEPFDLSKDHDLFRLKAISDSFGSVSRVINYGKSQFWLKQIRKIQGNNFDHELVLNIKEPQQLIKLYVKSLLQMSLDKERFDISLNEKDVNAKIEEIQEKKEIMNKYATFFNLITALHKESGIRDILDKKIPSHSGDLYFEDTMTRNELFALLFLRSIVDKSFQKYRQMKHDYSKIDDPDEHLFKWLLDHYKSDPESLIIHKAPPTKRRHKPIPDENSIVPRNIPFSLNKINNEHVEKITSLISQFESLDPIEWVSVVRKISDDNDLLKMLSECLDFSEQFGLPTSEKYTKTMVQLIAKTSNSPIDNIREDYNLFISSINEKFKNIIDDDSDEFGITEMNEEFFDSVEEILLGDNLHEYEIGATDQLEKYYEERSLYVEGEDRKIKRQAGIDEIDPEDIYRDIVEDLKKEKVDETLEEGTASENQETENEIEEILETKEITEEKEDNKLVLTEEEKALLEEIFDEKNLDTVLAEIRDEVIMENAGVIPFNENYENTFSGFPYDIRDVEEFDKKSALTMEEKSDPYFQIVLGLNDPFLLKMTRLLRSIESGTNRYGSPLVILSEMAYQVKRGAHGLDPTLPPRIKSFNPHTLKFQDSLVESSRNRESMNRISRDRKKEMGYDPSKFVFDIPSALESEDIFSHRSPINNRAINMNAPINEIPFHSKTYDEPTLIESVLFEIELRKALSANVTEDVKELIEDQYDKLVTKIKNEPLEVVKESTPLDYILEEEIEPEEVPEEVEEEKEERKQVIDLFDVGFSGIKMDTEQEMVQGIESEEKATFNLQGLVLTQKKIEESGIVAEEKESGLAAGKEEKIEQVVGGGIFKSFGFSNREKAKQEVDFLKLMKVIIPGFNYRAWLKIQGENFQFLLNQLASFEYNVIRLIANEQVLETWAKSDYFEYLTGNHNVILTNVYVDKDIPMCDVILKLDLSNNERIQVKLKLKIDYKNQMFFFIDSWSEKKERPMKLRLRLGKRRYGRHR